MNQRKKYSRNLKISFGIQNGNQFKKKNGIKRGSVNTFNQYKVRQKVGLSYDFDLNTENYKTIPKRGD